MTINKIDQFLKSEKTALFLPIFGFGLQLIGIFIPFFIVDTLGLYSYSDKGIASILNLISQAFVYLPLLSVFGVVAGCRFISRNSNR